MEFRRLLYRSACGGAPVLVLAWLPKAIALQQSIATRVFMSDVRIIKKYPNRRLYDTHISRYITLEEIRQLVLQDVKFRVEDKRTHDDITRSILLQVISDQEEGGDPIFTNDLLEFIIRYYGDKFEQ